jgi:hypothetical protein
MSERTDPLKLPVSAFFLHMADELAHEAKSIRDRDASARERGFASSADGLALADLLMAASEIAAELRVIGDRHEVRRAYAAARSAIQTSRNEREQGRAA